MTTPSMVNQAVDKTFMTLLAGGQYYAGCEGVQTNHPVTVMFDPCGATTNVKHKDPNALAVFNSRGVMMGYIPKEWAVLLGPHVGAGLIRITGIVVFTGGPGNTHLKYTVHPTGVGA